MKATSEQIKALETAIEDLDRQWDRDAERGLRDSRPGAEYERMSPAPLMRKLLADLRPDNSLTLGDEPNQEAVERMRASLRELGQPEVCGECGADWRVFESSLGDYYKTARRREDAPVAAMGIEPLGGYKTVPVRYDWTLTCENGHTHEFVKYVEKASDA